MDAVKALQMLEYGSIEGLRQMLEEEVYEKSLEGKGEKSRYKAMKRYFKYVEVPRTWCKMPMQVGEWYYLTDYFSMVRTREGVGTLELWEGKAPPVERNLFDGLTKVGVLDIYDILVKAKVKGYKLTKQTEYNAKYLWKFGDMYFSIALLDKAFAVVDTGDVPEFYVGEGNSAVLRTAVGECLVPPLKDPKLDSKVVIEL